jgi:hypothetical protein
VSGTPTTTGNYTIQISISSIRYNGLTTSTPLVESFVIS